ncbi:MAG: hypothetical protein RhofKO_30810 [Rhodothermales bacterium]
MLAKFSLVNAGSNAMIPNCKMRLPTTKRTLLILSTALLAYGLSGCDNIGLGIRDCTPRTPALARSVPDTFFVQFLPNEVQALYLKQYFVLDPSYQYSYTAYWKAGSDLNTFRAESTDTVLFQTLSRDTTTISLAARLYCKGSDIAFSRPFVVY